MPLVLVYVGGRTAACMSLWPVMIRYIVLRVRRENLADSCLAKNVGCALPSGGLVSAVLYAREERGA